MKGAKENPSLVDVVAAHQRDELPQDLVKGEDGQLAAPWLSSLIHQYKHSLHEHKSMILEGPFQLRIFHESVTKKPDHLPQAGLDLYRSLPTQDALRF